MTPEEERDFWEAIESYKLNPIPPPRVWIQGFGFMTEEGFDATGSKVMAPGRPLRTVADR
jgi:hypothetical protein